MKIERISVDKINPAAYNPRKDLKPGDAEYEHIKNSIDTFGYIDPIIWNKRTGNIVGGHQRFKILKAQGVKEIECVVVDYDETTEKAANASLNKAQGDWDMTKLDALLADLSPLMDMGQFGFEINLPQDSVEDDFDADKALEEIEEPVTKLGDIWALGRHRLMCGDSTSEADFDRLMDGAHAQCAVTSPPYGVGKEYEKAGIEPWFETMRPAIKNICKNADIVCWNIGDLYPTGTQFIEPTEMYSIGLFADNGFRPIWIRIWKKQGMNFGNSPYHLVTNKPVQQYEYITALAAQETDEYNDQEFAWVSAFAGHSYKFVKRLTKDERKNWGYAGIWEISTVRANKDHPAMFPVELPWRCIKMHSDRGSIVLEPFAGCGTTLIACEQTERRCYAMEISPVYCDLIVKRWETLTGQKAVLNE